MNFKMQVILTVVLVLFSSSVIRAATATGTGWTKAYGSALFDEEASSVIQTSDGGYAIAGWTNSHGAGSYDFWLVKVDASGNMQWNKTYGGTEDDYAFSVVQTSDGGCAVAGWTRSSAASGQDFLLVKTDSSGEMQWNRTYGGPNDDAAYSLAKTSDGGYVLAGSTYSYGNGSADFWLVKVDANGNAEWNQTYGGQSFDAAQSVIQTSEGGYAIAGRTYSYGAGNQDFWLVKTNANGSMLWSHAYGGAADDLCYSVVQTSEGGYALAGSTASYGSGGDDFWLVKTDENGSMQWNRTYGGTANDVALSMLQTSDQGYALAGFTDSYSAGGHDFWLVKTDANGSALWNQSYGGTSNELANSLIQAADGGYAMAGWTESQGLPDFWLVKTDGNGVVPEDPFFLLLALLITSTPLAVKVQRHVPKLKRIR